MKLKIGDGVITNKRYFGYSLIGKIIEIKPPSLVLVEFEYEVTKVTEWHHDWTLIRSIVICT